jgi:dimethylamine/trimethylamine dehydrogenase
VVLAEATAAVGGRVAKEARLPGLAAWIRVVDYRSAQLERLASVELAFHSPLDASEVLSYGFDHVCVATGARWRGDGVGRWHTQPLQIDAGMQMLTPDDLVEGARPRGKQVVLYDDDHYYMGGVLAELLVREGCDVTLVTPNARVSEWTTNTLEQDRIQRRVLELGVTVMTSHTLSGATAGDVGIACAYTSREQRLAADAVVMVTARIPADGIATELHARSDEWADAGLQSVQAVGDAWCPSTIAAAVWDGHRYAELVDAPAPGDEPTFLREIASLAPADLRHPAMTRAK